jgi:hypothetical protein
MAKPYIRLHKWIFEGYITRIQQFSQAAEKFNPANIICLDKLVHRASFKRAVFARCTQDR